MKLNATTKVILFTSMTASLVGAGIGFMADAATGAIIAVAMLFSFSMIYFVFIRPAMEHSRIVKTGRSGQATILAIHETGTRINNQPLVKFEVRIETQGMAPYTTTIKRVVSYLQIASFHVGAILPVMIDSKNHLKAVFLNEGDLPQNDLFSKVTDEQRKELEIKLMELNESNEQIRRDGVYAKAIVTKYTFMGVNVNGNNPLVTLEIQVLPHNEPAFPATVKAAIKNENIPKYQPGEDIGVKYMLNDRSKVAIDHA